MIGIKDHEAKMNIQPKKKKKKAKTNGDMVDVAHVSHRDY